MPRRNAACCTGRTRRPCAAAETLEQTGLAGCAHDRLRELGELAVDVARRRRARLGRPQQAAGLGVGDARARRITRAHLAAADRRRDADAARKTTAAHTEAAEPDGEARADAR